MLRWRRSLAAVATVLGLGAGLGTTAVATGGSAGASPGGEPPARITMFYTPPVLVRAGEPVRVPLDVVCATASGATCRADLTVGIASPGAAWRTVHADAVHQADVDLTRETDRSLQRADGSRAGTGLLELSLRADAGALHESFGSAAAPIETFVATSMPAIDVPALAFGHALPGTPVLRLGWGTGENDAGLQPAHESATIGPSAFAIEGEGRVVLADGVRGRLATFAGGRLVASAAMRLGPFAAIAPDGRGGVYVGDRSRSVVTLRHVGIGGAVGTASMVGSRMLAGVRVVDGRPFVSTLPESMWRAPGSTSAPTIGEPQHGGTQMLLSATNARIRLGLAREDTLLDAIELRSAQAFGDVPLAEPDGAGGYVVVVHRSRDGADATDEYQVIRIDAARRVTSFSVPSGSFADTPGLSRFRFTGDALYQLQTFPDGMRIVRYDLGEDR